MIDQHAPMGKFRVIGVDTFEGPNADYLIKDCDTLAEAQMVAKLRGGEMNPVYVYNDSAQLLFKAGTT